MIKLAERITIVKVKMQAIPKSWGKAAGLLKGKKKALSTHAKQVRKEWSER
jgi:hypothetical protein